MDYKPGDIRVVSGIAGHKHQVMVQRGGGNEEIRDAIIDRPPPVPEIKPYLGDPARNGTADAEHPSAGDECLEPALACSWIPGAKDPLQQFRVRDDTYSNAFRGKLSNDAASFPVITQVINDPIGVEKITHS